MDVGLRMMNGSLIQDDGIAIIMDSHGIISDGHCIIVERVWRVILNSRFHLFPEQLHPPVRCRWRSSSGVRGWSPERGGDGSGEFTLASSSGEG